MLKELELSYIAGGNIAQQHWKEIWWFLQKFNMYMEFRKMAVTTLYARQEKDTDVYNGLLDSEGEGEGGMIWENDILTCILSCKN